MSCLKQQLLTNLENAEPGEKRLALGILADYLEDVGDGLGLVARWLHQVTENSPEKLWEFPSRISRGAYYTPSVSMLFHGNVPESVHRDKFREAMIVREAVHFDGNGAMDEFAWSEDRDDAWCRNFDAEEAKFLPTVDTREIDSWLTNSST